MHHIYRIKISQRNPLSLSMTNDINMHCLVGHTYHFLSVTLSNDFVISEVGDGGTLLKRFCNVWPRWLRERGGASYE